MPRSDERGLLHADRGVIGGGDGRDFFHSLPPPLFWRRRDGLSFVPPTFCRIFIKLLFPEKRYYSDNYLFTYNYSYTFKKSVDFEVDFRITSRFSSVTDIFLKNA